jgi:hypothetical protein
MRKIIATTGLTLISALTLLVYGCGGGGYGGGSYGGGGGGGYGGGGGGGGGIVTSIVISPTTASVAAGGTQQFMAVAKDSNGMVVGGSALTWASSNKAVATINSNGLATAVAVGSTSITASSGYLGTTYTSNTATLTVTTSDAVMGTAAVGRALAGALITLKDGHGHVQAGISDAQGHFMLSTAGMKGPFLLKADDGRGRVLFGVTADAGVANIDTVTDLMLRAWYGSRGSSPEQGFADMAGHPAPDAKSLQGLDRSFGGLLKEAMVSEGLDAGKFSLLSTPFDADSTGFDAVLDHTQAMTGSRLQLQDGLMGRTTDIGFAQGELNFTTR